MENRYSIFKVYDYKGGELTSKINLSEKKFIEALGELFENIDFDELPEITEESILKRITKEEKSNNFYSEYACDESFTGEIYEHIDNKLKKVKLKNYLPQVAKYLFTLYSKQDETNRD
jgi:hypothetical protein